MGSAPTHAIRASREADGARLAGLWARALGDTWPIRGDRLDEVVQDCEVLVAEQAGALAGFVAARRIDSRAAIIVIAVDPACQRRHIGSGLLEGAVSRLRASGARTVTLGAGAGAYFWPGVPENLAAANVFFAAHGWSRDEVVADLVGDCRGFRAPAAVLRRAGEAGVTFEVAGPGDADDVLLLQGRHFPYWTDEFRRRLARPGGVLLGRLAAGRVVATCTLDEGDDYPFSALIGARVGGLGAVGVDPSFRGRGIGLALVARATELVGARGNDQCFIGYTHLPGWYGRLGFRTWRTYRMGSKEVGLSADRALGPVETLSRWPTRS